MSEGQKSLVLIVLQYSVVVKGIERKLKDAGYKASILSEGFEKLRDISCSTDLFLLYLPGNIAEMKDKLEELTYICDKVNRSGRSMIIIGEEKDRADLFDKVPMIGDYTWVDRPVEMDILVPVIENAVGLPGSSGHLKRILIVDDDSSYAKMIREWIRKEYQTDIVTAGMQAIKFLLKNRVDLILLDYEMPVIDGPQVFQMLKQEPDTKDIPVIFLTGIGNREAVERVMSLKPDGYILKSTSRENLLNLLYEKLK